MDDVREWQQRPLDDVYPVVFLDALVLKIREGGSVQRRACYLALGVTLEGERDVLGMWFQETEGAKFWMQVLSELKQRGVKPLIARRNTEHGSGLGRDRWVVERTFAWLHNRRRLLLRTDRRHQTHEAFLDLACCLICWRRIETSFS